MSAADWGVLLGSIAFLGLFFWWFFLSKRGPAVAAQVTGSGTQEVEIVVKGGYSPDHVSVMRGKPVRLRFRREESGECTDRVVIPEFHISQPLPAYATTPVEFTPADTGDFEFSCGMGMIHGKIQVRDS